MDRPTAIRRTGPAGHLDRAAERAGQAASRTARRIWDPLIDRHVAEADRVTPPRDTTPADGETGVAMTLAAWGSLIAYGLLMGLVIFVWGAR